MLPSWRELLFTLLFFGASLGRVVSGVLVIAVISVLCLLSQPTFIAAFAD